MTHIQIPQLDAPPIELIEEHVPELAEELRAVHAALDARSVARDRVDAAAEPRLGALGGENYGSEVRAALAADVEAVAEGTQPTAYAEVVTSRPQRGGELHACAGYAARLVERWNASAHERVKPETREHLLAEAPRLWHEVEAAAAEALAAAQTAGSHTDDQARMMAAWEELAAMDAKAREWRPMYALASWCAARRPLRSSRTAWNPLQGKTYPDSETVRAARALRDPQLRRSMELAGAAGAR